MDNIDYKVGDIVVCVTLKDCSERFGLEEGEIYRISGIIKSKQARSLRVTIDGQDTHTFFAWRFERMLNDATIQHHEKLILKEIYGIQR